MVNNSKHEPPSGDNPSDEERRIQTTGPIHDIAKVKEIAASGKVFLVTQKCIDDVADLDWTEVNVADLVKDIDRSHYLGSEWCEPSPGKNPKKWIDCDAYRVVRMEYFEAAHRSFRTEYYIKFGIGPTGNLLLFVSCHLSRQR